MWWHDWCDSLTRSGRCVWQLQIVLFVLIMINAASFSVLPYRSLLLLWHTATITSIECVMAFSAGTRPSNPNLFTPLWLGVLLPPILSPKKILPQSNKTHDLHLQPERHKMLLKPVWKTTTITINLATLDTHTYDYKLVSYFCLRIIEDLIAQVHR